MVWSIRHPVKSVALVLPATGSARLPMQTAQFFPGEDRDQFHIEVEMAAGTGSARTREVAARMDAVLRGADGVVPLGLDVPGTRRGGMILATLSGETGRLRQIVESQLILRGTDMPAEQRP